MKSVWIRIGFVILVFALVFSCSQPVSAPGTMIWKGELAAAPANPQNSWVYYNTTDYTCYIYQSGNWRTLFARIEVPVTNVIWKGSLTVAPASPETCWAYYNTSNGTSYIYDGESWQIIAADRVETITETVNQILWQGELTSAPATPAIGWAYYNTGNTTSYLWDGTDWVVLSRSTAGQDVPIATVIWKGSLTADPTDPAIGWAYYNTETDTSYIWDGTFWQIISTDRVTTTEVEVAVIYWKGQLEAAPTGAATGWAYYNTTDSKSWLYDGSTWVTIAQTSTVITNEVYWLGPSSEGPPPSPVAGSLYYDTVEGATYLYTGTAWEAIARDTGSSLNVAGARAPGAWLSLYHGLNRSDLTFNAQFLKDGFVYNHGEYNRLYGLPAFAAGRRSFSAVSVDNVSAVKLATSPNNTLVAYREASIGKLQIIAQDGSVVRQEQIFCGSPVYFITATALANGSFVIAYCNEDTGGKGYFDIWDADGTTRLVTAQEFAGFNLQRIELAALAESSFAILYKVEVSGGDMAMKIYDAAGTLVKDMTYVAAGWPHYVGSSFATLTNGDLAVLSEIHNTMVLYGATYSPLGSAQGTFTAIDNCDSAWQQLNTANAQVTVSLDTTTKYEGTGALKIEIPAAYSGGDQWLAYRNVTERSLRPNDSMWSLRIRSDQPIPADTLFLAGFSNTGSGTTRPVENQYGDFSNPYIPADTWVEVDFCYRSGSGSTWNQTLSSVAVRFTYDNSVDQTIWIDDIREAPLNRLSPPGFHLQASDPALYHKSLLALPDDKILGLFRKQGTAYLYARIFRSSMDGMLSETLINPYSVDLQPGMALLADNSVAIAYRDTARAETTLVLLDSSGRITKSPTKLTDNSYESIHLLPLNQGGFSLYARDATMDFGVYHQSGNPSLELVEISPNEVRLYNLTPESLELRLSVNQ